MFSQQTLVCADKFLAPLPDIASRAPPPKMGQFPDNYGWSSQMATSYEDPTALASRDVFGMTNGHSDYDSGGPLGHAHGHMAADQHFTHYNNNSFPGSNTGSSGEDFSGISGAEFNDSSIPTNTEMHHYDGAAISSANSFHGMFNDQLPGFWPISQAGSATTAQGMTDQRHKAPHNATSESKKGGTERKKAMAQDRKKQLKKAESDLAALQASSSLEHGSIGFIPIANDTGLGFNGVNQSTDFASAREGRFPNFSMPNPSAGNNFYDQSLFAPATPTNKIDNGPSELSTSNDTLHHADSQMTDATMHSDSLHPSNSTLANLAGAGNYQGASEPTMNFDNNTAYTAASGGISGGLYGSVIDYGSQSFDSTDYGDVSGHGNGALFHPRSISGHNSFSSSSSSTLLPTPMISDSSMPSILHNESFDMQGNDEWGSSANLYGIDGIAGFQDFAMD